MEILDIKSFNNACDEFLAGKYILAEVKIASILREINTNEKLKNIVSDCIENYDFRQEYKKLVNEEQLTISMPVEEKSIIAFGYSLLYNFENKQLSFYDFVHKYFRNEDAPSMEVYTFASTLILPFKNAVNSIYSKTHIIVTTDEYQQNHYNQIMTVTKEIINNVDNYRLKMAEKEEFTLLLNSLYLASDKNDKKLVFSLMVGLDYFTKYHKRCRPAYLSLEQCFSK